jgi:hypothetical protein
MVANHIKAVLRFFLVRTDLAVSTQLLHESFVRLSQLKFVDKHLGLTENKRYRTASIEEIGRVIFTRRLMS